MPGSGEPPAESAGDPDRSGISRSDHARLRFGQGRPIAEVINDVQRAGTTDVFVQVDNGRFVVRGPKGREHIIEPNGRHLTSLRRPDVAHRARLQAGKIRPVTDEEFQTLKTLVQ